MAANYTLRVNGRSRRVRVDDPQMPLLYALRNDLDLHGPRFGCGLAQCGACTVHVDGRAQRSCVFPVSKAANREILTLEGLGTPRKPHRLQQAFIEEQAAQCGYCINGMIMQAKACKARLSGSEAAGVTFGSAAARRNLWPGRRGVPVHSN